MDEQKPCRACGEPTLGQATGDIVCRNCDIEELIDATRCDECRAVIWNENSLHLGWVPFAHESTCKSGRLERASGIEIAACAIFLQRFAEAPFDPRRAPGESDSAWLARLRQRDRVVPALG